MLEAEAVPGDVGGDACGQDRAQLGGCVLGGGEDLLEERVVSGARCAGQVEVRVHVGAVGVGARLGTCGAGLRVGCRWCRMVVASAGCSIISHHVGIIPIRYDNEVGSSQLDVARRPNLPCGFGRASCWCSPNRGRGGRERFKRPLNHFASRSRPLRTATQPLASRSRAPQTATQPFGEAVATTPWGTSNQVMGRGEPVHAGLEPRRNRSHSPSERPRSDRRQREAAMMPAKPLRPPLRAASLSGSAACQGVRRRVASGVAAEEVARRRVESGVAAEEVARSRVESGMAADGGARSRGEGGFAAGRRAAARRRCSRLVRTGES